MDARLVYVGSFTPPGGEGRGITVARQVGDGGLEVVGEVAAVAPSFLVWHPTLPRLYAVGTADEGTVTAYRVDEDGRLTALVERSTGGGNPCHLAVGAGGDVLAVANYSDGRVATYRLDADGVPGEAVDVLAHSGGGPRADRQDGPHAHFVRYDDGVLHAVDLGTDEVRRYVTGDDGRAMPHPDGHARLRAGSGPRHLVTDGRGGWVVADELDGTVTSYLQGDDGRWSEVSRLPGSTSKDTNYPSHIELSGDGRYVYVANRGPDTVGVFHLDRGQLTAVGEVATGGSWPRHFALADGRLYVANERSHDVTVFDVSRALPEPTGHRLETPSPGCVLPR